ncbi:MAG: hypothetical protein HY700_10265 [Gemmatimonadetes bacterium]|nr:hypothetical protein [Gemmatimonadota bacterium]
MASRFSEPLIAAAALLVVACASHQLPVPVVGGPAGLQTLVGDWGGEYWSPITGRNGSIRFTLAAGRDTAFGDILMIPRGSNQPFSRENADPMSGAAAVLTIRFVRVAGDSVHGVLDPYRDPDCSCTLRTAFRGRIATDSIVGTFISRRVDRDERPATGEWRVTRQRG